MDPSKSLLIVAKVNPKLTDIEMSSTSQDKLTRTETSQENNLYIKENTRKDEMELLHIDKNKEKRKQIDKNMFQQEIRNTQYRTHIGRIYKNEKIELKLATHNINGLKANSQKLESLYEWMIDNELDIVGLSETNISAKEGFFLTRNLEGYKSFWSNACPNKKKGSGVGLLISNQWEKHLGRIDRVNEYIVLASFMFKQLEIMVIMMYLPPNDKEKQRLIQKTIIDKYIKRLERTQMVIMGDFNSVVDVNLDRLTKSKKKQQKPNPLLGWLERQEFKDTFRLINPESKEVSWSGRGSGSRIDYIWITEE